MKRREHWCRYCARFAVGLDEIELVESARALGLDLDFARWLRSNFRGIWRAGPWAA